MRFQVLSITVAIVASSLSAYVPELIARPIAMAEDGHKHGEDEKKKLGRQKIGDYTISVIMIGDTHDDKEIEFDVKLIDPKSEPKALRVWIGTEDGKGSVKADLAKKTTTYTATAKVPSPMPTGAKVWVEVETEAGTTKGSYTIEDTHKH